MGGVSALDAALDARLPPVGHLTMHHQTAPVHPHVVAPSRRAGRPFGVFPGPLRNGVQSPGGVDEHRGGRRVTRERRKDYRVRGGTSRPAVHSGAEHAARTRRAPGPGRHWRWSRSSGTTAPRSPGWAAIAFAPRHQSTVSSPTLTPTSTGSRPARHPESGGLPRPRGRRGRPGRPVQAGPQGP